MGFADLLPILASAGLVGLVGLVARLAYRMHRDAIDAHKNRADDWREAFKTASERADKAEARADLRDDQVQRILDAVKAVTRS